MEQLPALKALLAYRNPRVVQKFQREFPQVTTDANALFSELLKYLWLAQKQRLERNQAPQDDNLDFLLAIYDDMIHIDQLWHCFILCTKDYVEFCDCYFGRYMHHVPDAFDSLPPTKEKFAADLEKFASYVYDHLGIETVQTWFGLKRIEEHEG